MRESPNHNVDCLFCYERIREWTGLKFFKSQRALEKRTKLEKTGCEVICGAPTTFHSYGISEGGDW